MPLITLSTNLPPISGDGNKISIQLSKAASDWLGKPESFMMVKIDWEKEMLFSGSTDPCALATIDSLGLPESSTANLSEKLCNLLSELLPLDPARVYIHFSSPPRTMWGWDGKTFG